MKQVTFIYTLPEIDSSIKESLDLMSADVDCLESVVDGLLLRHLDCYVLDNDLVSFLLRLQHLLKFVSRETPVDGENYVV